MTSPRDPESRPDGDAPPLPHQAVEDQGGPGAADDQAPAPEAPGGGSQPDDAPAVSAFGEASAPTSPGGAPVPGVVPAGPAPGPPEPSGQDAAPSGQSTPPPEQSTPPSEDPEDPEESRSENALRRRLGLDPLGWTLPLSVRVSGWVATVLATLVAAFTRLSGLGHPSTLMFDEIYYAKDAWALSHVGYEANWTEGADAAFAQGDMSHLTEVPSFVVHPQLGKWLIALGMKVVEPGNAVGWRLAPAVAGILTVFLLARLTMRLTRSPLLAGLAGLLLAIDGVGITESRIALLDVFIGLFATLSLYCLVRDRESSRARLARDLADTPPGTTPRRPHLRPWLLATGVSLGLTCSIKWSGLFLLAVVGVLVVVWDTLALRRVGVRRWLAWGVLVRGSGDFLRTVPVALAVYVAGWWSWFTHPNAFKHGWAAAVRAADGHVTRGWLPDSLNDLIEYHIRMYTFHVNLDSSHPYMAKPTMWLPQLRPTSFFWPDLSKSDVQCGSEHCVQAITSLGNVVVWWSALVALVVLVVVLAGVRRDWRAWVPLAGYLGLYLPWFKYWNRTIFQFYTVAFVPMVVLTLVLVLGQVMGLLTPVPGSAADRAETAALQAGRIGEGVGAPRGAFATFLGLGTRSRRRERRRILLARQNIVSQPADYPTGQGAPTQPAGYPTGQGTTTQPASRLSLEAVTGVPSWRVRREGVVTTVVIVLLAIAFAVAWWPIWTGKTISYDTWYWHMWIPSWV